MTRRVREDPHGYFLYADDVVLIVLQEKLETWRQVLESRGVKIKQEQY